jgi:hypothetical protein
MRQSRRGRLCIQEAYHLQHSKSVLFLTSAFSSAECELLQNAGWRNISNPFLDRRMKRSEIPVSQEEDGRIKR